MPLQIRSQCCTVQFQSTLTISTDTLPTDSLLYPCVTDITFFHGKARYVTSIGKVRDRNTD